MAISATTGGTQLQKAEQKMGPHTLQSQQEINYIVNSSRHLNSFGPRPKVPPHAP